jgi:xanthine dehydrogenase small subunit
MSNRVRFLLGEEPVEIAVDDPTRTVLQYLRSDPARRGTKEGCAEGDCGACTVAVGERAADRGMTYRAVNACIQFLPTLDGKQLLTVEDLADRSSGALHPVQQALVDGHGSQCGFCTPGFAMSLFVGYGLDRAAGRVPSREAIDDRLAGNLCRCTGYRPIVDAARRAATIHEPVGWAAFKARSSAALAGIARSGTLVIDTGTRRYFAPRDLVALGEILERHPDACLLAGGTDVGLWVTKQHRVLETVVYVGDVAPLKTVEDRGQAWWIGGAATFTEASRAFADLHPDFAEVLRRIGSLQIRNAGTVGGNIANGSPIGDSMPGLIALGARLHLRRGRRSRELALEDFFLAYRKTALEPGEFVEGVSVPKLGPDQRFATYKISKRFDQDISALCPAFRVTLVEGRVSDARIAFGGMAATPKRAARTETALAGQPWTEATVRRAIAALAEDYRPIGDMRASARYRATVAGNMLLRFFLETEGRTSRTRVLAPRESAA